MPQRKDRAIRGALGFYGSEDCIVAGPARDPCAEKLGTHWHHLDEHKTNWIPENIVRLRADFNHAIELHRRNPRFDLPSQVAPDTLLDLSLRDYGNRAFARGYGCARLGSFIAMNHGENWDKAVRLATCAFLNLRPLGQVQFAVDTFDRTVFEILNDPKRRRQIQPRTLSELVFEVGTYFINYGFPDVYLTWKAYANALLERTVLTDNDVDGLRARILQHQGIGLIAIGESVLGRELLARALEVYPKYSPRGGSANDAMWRLKEAIQCRNIDRAEELADVLKRMGITPDVYYWTREVRNPPTVGWQIWGKALGKLGDLHLIKGDLSMADQFAEAANVVYRAARIQPAATLPSAALESFRRRYATPTGVVVERRPEDLTAFAVGADKLLKILRTDGLLPGRADIVNSTSRQLDR